MNKEELIISEKYENLVDDSIEQLYLNLYCGKVSDNIKYKLLTLFAFLHNKINYLLGSFNYRVQGNRHFLANDSRLLISIIDDTFELIEVLRGTKYEFRLERTYYFYLKKTKSFLNSFGGTSIPETVQPITIIKYDKIFTFLKDEYQYIDVDSVVDDSLSKISTRRAAFNQMEIDEKISSINMLIENILKKDKKYIIVDCEKLFKGLITNEIIKQYRTLTNCFRHGSEQMISERASFSEKEKTFLVNFGITICNGLSNLD